MTIELRCAGDRRRVVRPNDEVWRTFDPDVRGDALAGGFASLELLNESRIGPRARVPRYSHGDAEIISYVREGTLSYEDGAGRPGRSMAGEFRRMTAGAGFRHREMNSSPSDLAHVFHIVLRSAGTGIEPSHEQQRFSVAERRDTLCVVASPDARNRSLRMRQDTVVFSALLDAGRHVVHALARGRCAWLHVVTGEIQTVELPMRGGDGAGFEQEPRVSVTAPEKAEILLVDMAEGVASQRAE